MQAPSPLTVCEPVEDIVVGVHSASRVKTHTGRSSAGTARTKKAMGSGVGRADVSGVRPRPGRAAADLGLPGQLQRAHRALQLAAADVARWSLRNRQPRAGMQMQRAQQNRLGSATLQSDANHVVPVGRERAGASSAGPRAGSSGNSRASSAASSATGTRAANGVPVSLGNGPDASTHTGAGQGAEPMQEEEDVEEASRYEHYMHTRVRAQGTDVGRRERRRGSAASSYWLYDPNVTLVVIAC